MELQGQAEEESKRSGFTFRDFEGKWHNHFASTQAGLFEMALKVVLTELGCDADEVHDSDEGSIDITYDDLLAAFDDDQRSVRRGQGSSEFTNVQQPRRVNDNHHANRHQPPA